jgi:hypothetical protein
MHHAVHALDRQHSVLHVAIISSRQTANACPPVLQALSPLPAPVSLAIPTVPLAPLVVHLTNVHLAHPVDPFCLMADASLLAQKINFSTSQVERVKTATLHAPAVLQPVHRAV